MPSDCFAGRGSSVWCVCWNLIELEATPGAGIRWSWNAHACDNSEAGLPLF